MGPEEEEEEEEEEVPKSQSDMVAEEMHDSFNAHLEEREEQEEAPAPAEEQK